MCDGQPGDVLDTIYGWKGKVPGQSSHLAAVSTNLRRLSIAHALWAFVISGLDHNH